MKIEPKKSCEKLVSFAKIEKSKIAQNDFLTKKTFFGGENFSGEKKFPVKKISREKKFQNSKNIFGGKTFFRKKNSRQENIFSFC